MSVTGLVPLPLEIFGGKVSDIPPADLPSGASPNCQDVIFPPGSVKTRPGLASQFTAFAGNPTVNYVKTLILDNATAGGSPQELDLLLMLDSLGVMRKESGLVVSTVG